MEQNMEESTNKKKKKKALSILLLLILVLGITIGYATLTQTLTINGSSTINNPTWDVHFENVVVTTGSNAASVVPTAQPSDKKTTINFQVALDNPGEFYEFTVNVKNGGTMTAELNAVPELGGVSTAQDVYTNFTFKNSDGTAVTAGQTLAAGESKTYRVRVEFDSNISASQLPTSQQTMNLTASMTWVQA